MSKNVKKTLLLFIFIGLFLFIPKDVFAADITITSNTDLANYFNTTIGAGTVTYDTSNADIVYLEQDVTVADTLYIDAGSNVMLSLNNHVLTRDGDIRLFDISGGNLTVLDFDSSTNGKIYCDNGTDYLFALESGTLTIDGGAYENATTNGYLIIANGSNSTLNIKNGSFNSANSSLELRENSVTTVSGGTLTASRGATFELYNDAKLTVNGGIFNSLQPISLNKEDYTLTNVVLNGGTYNSTDNTMPMPLSIYDSTKTYTDDELTTLFGTLLGKNVFYYDNTNGTDVITYANDSDTYYMNTKSVSVLQNETTDIGKYDKNKDATENRSSLPFTYIYQEYGQMELGLVGGTYTDVMSLLSTNADQTDPRYVFLWTADAGVSKVYASYLQTLPVGKYDLKWTAQNHSIYHHIFEVVDTTIPNPQTSDSIMTYITLGIISFISIVSISLYLQKKNN